MQLFIPIFVHGDEYHLYYNMASLLMKGVALELRRGSESFAVLVASFVVANAFAFVALSYFTGWSFHACTVGFSGVLFSLKVVVNFRAPKELQCLGCRFRQSMLLLQSCS